MSDPIIQFEHFGFQYNAQSEPTLYDINLTVHKGEKLLIAGPSGCGKSTLAHCINGLIPFSYRGESSGTLKIKGKETRELGIFGISHTVGTVLQDPDGQFIGLTVAEDIAFALENDCVAEPELHERVQRASRMVNIQDHLGHAPNELSGGQKQRVSLAGVMVDDVEVLLFDEPLANLDPATGKTAMELIDEIQRQTGAAVIIIEHRLEDVLHRHVDRIVLMGKGRILADTSPAELLSGSWLADSGIREPLYLTALKYAGVTIRPEMHPESIEALTLDEEDQKKLRDWFHAVPPAPEKPARPVQLRAEGLGFTYPGKKRQTIRDLSTQIRQGELLAIVGTNGAGKSTFSKLICGFETQQEGSLHFEGEDLAALSIKERADRIGYVMQNPNQMISKVMIFDEVALGLRTRKVPEDEVREALAFPELADLGPELRTEKARHHRLHPGPAAQDDHPGRAHRRAGLPALYRHHGVSHGVEPARHHRGDDHPRYAPDAGVRRACAGLLSGAHHRGYGLRRGSDRPGDHPGGEPQGDLSLRTGTALRPGGQPGLCPALHRL